MMVFVLYLGTVAPGVLPFDPPEIHDAEMIQMQVCTLSITHPTGYPSYMMLAHLFTYLPFGDCAYRSNLASAGFSALAVGVVYATGYVLSRRVIAALVGAVAFGVGTTLWSQSVMAEVYTANALFVALAVFVLISWSLRRTDGLLVAGAFCTGLAVTNHMTSALLVPAALLLVAFSGWRTMLRARLMLACCGAFVVGLLPYLYLPVRARSAPMIANDPANLDRFLYVVAGGDLRGGFFAFGPSELPGRVAFYFGHLSENFHFGLIVLAVVGFGGLVVWRRPLAVFTGFLFAGWVFYAIQNDISDIEVYFIPTYLIFSVWISCGVALLVEECEAFVGNAERPVMRMLPFLLAGAVMLLPVSGVFATYTENDRSEDYRARQIIENVARNVPQGATVLHLRSNLWYMVLVEERRTDLTLVDPFQGWEGGNYSDVVWPEKLTMPEKRLAYGIGDPTGVTAATRATERGDEVYLLAHEALRFEYFEAAGFGVERVEGDLYRIIPPDGEGRL